MDENIVLENISRVTETRKTYSPNSNSSVRIQGTWTLDPSSTEIDFVTVLVPAWIMEITIVGSTSILNAVSGFSSSIYWDYQVRTSTVYLVQQLVRISNAILLPVLIGLLHKELP